MKTNSRSGIAAPYPSSASASNPRRPRPPTRPGAAHVRREQRRRSLRERLGGTTEDRLGKALSDLLENPLLTGAIGRAFDAREKAAQAQEVAMGALNIPSAADIERLTRRLRSVSHRLEGIEDGVERLDRALRPRGGRVGSACRRSRSSSSGSPSRLDQAAQAADHGARPRPPAARARGRKVGDAAARSGQAEGRQRKAKPAKR